MKNLQDELIKSSYIRLVTTYDLDGESCLTILDQFFESRKYYNKMISVNYIRSIAELDAIIKSQRDELILVCNFKITDKIANSMSNNFNSGKNIFLINNDMDSIKYNTPWNLSRIMDRDQKELVSCTELLAESLFDNLEYKFLLSNFTYLISIYDKVKDLNKDEVEYFSLAYYSILLNEFRNTLPNNGTFFAQEMSERLSVGYILAPEEYDQLDKSMKESDKLEHKFYNVYMGDENEK